MTDEQRKILVTSALPYANGSIHIGHMVEYIQTDVWVRFQRLRGNHCLYVCADDAHGTPIMLRAEQEGITPQELIDQMLSEHKQDFADFLVDFDNYHTTHSEENRSYATEIYSGLKSGGYVVRKTIPRPYDPIKKMFLPDRYIRGDCPICGEKDQYGDSCESCGATYTPSDLKNPRSAISGASPELRDSDQFFVRLSSFEGMLKTWMKGGHPGVRGKGNPRPAVQPEIANKLNEWFEAGLQDWDISRNAPYFGFEIPGETDKYFYVWLDAPIGYMASFKNLCARDNSLDFDEYWGPDSSTELHHFIGKDIAYFHTLFWPAELHGAGHRTPTAVHCHGFLTVNGQKMSKSRGTFIKARTYLEYLAPEYLRYYFACKLNSGIDDIDLNFNDFVQRVNSDLVGKVVNIASRCAGFITKEFEGRLAEALPDPGLYAEFVNEGEVIAQYYEDREYGRAMRAIMALADRANQYIDEKKPWLMVKDPDQRSTVCSVCSQGLNLFRILAIYLFPVLPKMAEDVGKLFNHPIEKWHDVHCPLTNHTIRPFQSLMKRVDNKNVEAMVLTAKEDGTPMTKDDQLQPIDPVDAEISFDDFAKVDMRVAKIVDVTYVEGADKLLKLIVDIGGEKRQVFAGIKAAYEPDVLMGRYTIVVANLAPRKMRFGVSEGMMLAAGPGGEEIWLLSPDQGARSGMRVK